MVSAFITRRLLRVSLRGLLLVVTMTGVLLGWQVYAVHQRSAARQALETRGAVAIGCVPFDMHLLQSGHMLCGHHAVLADMPGPSVPRLRAWFGDKPIELVIVGTEPDALLARRLFPEAEVVHGTADGAIIGIGSVAEP